MRPSVLFLSIGVFAGGAAAGAATDRRPAIDRQAPVQPASPSVPARPSIDDRLARVRADLFSRTARFADDVRELKEILAIDPNSAEGHLLLGIAYRGVGTQEVMGEAVAELRQALALNPDFVPARFYLAHIYLDLGRAGRAREEMLAALEKTPGNPQFLALLGEAERQLKNPSRAVEVIRQALAADASLAEARYYLGLALFDLGQKNEAIKELALVVQAGAPVADPYISLGTAYVEAGRLDDAIETLTRGTGVDPGRPELRIQLARAYRLKGSLAKADEQLRLAAPKRNGSLAASYYLQQQVDLDLHLERGILSLQQGRPKAAVDALRKVLDAEPDHALGNRYMAEAYLQQGAYRLASEHAARAQKAGAPLPEDKRRLIQEGLRKQ